jgi:hypothetical protein
MKYFIAASVDFNLALVEAGQDVARQREQLQADVDGDEVDARGHEHHAAEGEGEQRVVLPRRVARLGEEVVGEQHEQPDRGDEEKS